MTRRVVITGLGALTPIGNDTNTFWSSLIAGKNGAAAITKFDTELFKTKFACELKGLDLEDHFDRKEVRKNDPFTLYALIASEQAVKDSHLDPEKIDLNKFGVIWASGNGGIDTFEREVIEYAHSDRGPRFSPFFIPKILVDTPSGAIALRYGARGINYCTVSACASSTSAVMDAFNYIKWGKANLMLAGGSEAPITRAGIGGFGAMKALSTRNDDPATASRPFDIDRDGFVMGEGAGALILEELEHAKARGATIYAEIVGAGMSNDAYHATATHPEGLGAILAMEMALEDAQIKPGEIDYINLHATSTPVGDVSELNAIARLFKDDLSRLHVSATKSMTGHLLGAAGAVEAIAAVKAVQENIIPPTINTVNVDPEMPEGIDLTLGKPVEKTINYAMSNTFGFGGHNAIALFKKWEGK
ncbi:3-oxoacyl-[acyl-carrier-protein] synthase, KASII [Fulvivirga imtechensis AK7]|uniref:3-oxoacyl-[acyl-carrier-protein] synthase 2 n=1 Tax=Fulvivirga imtechensis AK7 TaxID=1237149 RepID=L8JYS2_9BACT|nr:beta-ketoacyl-ACP synthase II [Fulvivirga imtechensis]ELR72779.1 3-oxoacyl-[acyl-carrier-protein] synthase, KASII [Fulvivirga imtechensis AK7]